jgi:hypothetical protein
MEWWRYDFTCIPGLRFFMEDKGGLLILLDSAQFMQFERGFILACEQLT